MRNIITIGLLVLIYPISAQTFESKSYYEEGDEKKIKEIITLRVKDSVTHGPYFSFFQSGSPRIEGYYDEGKPDSLWVYYFENGNKKSSGLFQQSDQTGLWDYFFESGALKASGSLDRGQKSGYWSNYYENGNEKSSGGYYKDLKEGIWNYFFEDGAVKAQAYYEQGDGIYKQFYPSGELRMEGLNKDGKSQGNWIYFYETGEKQAEGEFVAGLRNGLWAFYHKNGQVSAKGAYLEGKKIGLWTYYHENGQKSGEGVLVENQRDGQWNLYYDTGEIRAKSAYTTGDGVFTEYYPSGKQKAKGQILEGRRDGKWIFFNENGVLDGEAQFDLGEGEYIGYYPDQQVKMKGPMKGEKRTGEWQLFNPDGTVAGIYKPIYEEDRPVFRIVEPANTAADDRNPVEKPEYLFKDNSVRYFTSTINEFQAVIIGSNPAWILLDEFPISAEYYFQERLGYELQAVYHRKNFFERVEDLNINETYSRGVTIRFRQKFYSLEQNFGLFYFGHQISASVKNHKARVLDQAALPFGRTTIGASEVLGTYGLFVGLRWMRITRNPGFSIDVYVGMDIGFRRWEALYSDRNQFDPIFESFDKSGLRLPIQFGLNFGGVFSTKAKSIQNSLR